MDGSCDGGDGVVDSDWTCYRDDDIIKSLIFNTRKTLVFNTTFTQIDKNECLHATFVAPSRGAICRQAVHFQNMSPHSHTNAVFSAVFTQSSTHINGTQQYSWQVAAHKR